MRGLLTCPDGSRTAPPGVARAPDSDQCKMHMSEPTFYFSLRSPYSWLAIHDLKTRYPKLLERLALKPFWEPDEELRGALGKHGEAFLYTAMSKEKHLYILMDVRRLARKRGLTIAWPQDKSPRWEVPHLAYFVAERAGKALEFIEAVKDMRWKLGRDICDPGAMEEVGCVLGLDPIELRDAHLDPQIRAEGLQALRACIRAGVFGVPFFTAGREKFWGIDRLHEFAGSVGQEAAPVEMPIAMTGSALLDHAGGCG